MVNQLCSGRCAIVIGDKVQRGPSSLFLRECPCKTKFRHNRELIVFYPTSRAGMRPTIKCVKQHVCIFDTLLVPAGVGSPVGRYP